MTSPGYPKVVTKSDIGGRGVHANSDITTKKIMYKFLFFTCFWSARRIRWWCCFKHWPESARAG